LALQAEGKLSEAEDIDTRTLAIRRKRLGHENAQIAVSLNNLGSVYRDRGKLKQAKAATLDALEMRQKLFGSPSLEVADSLRNLSLILGDERDWPAAANAREVLAIRRKLLGSEHPWIASALADVAWAVREGHTNRPKQHRWKEKLWPCVKSS
jgi:tetratricopeptide (TPR) repeat protein